MGDTEPERDLQSLLKEQLHNDGWRTQGGNRGAYIGSPDHPLWSAPVPMPRFHKFTTSEARSIRFAIREAVAAERVAYGGAIVLAHGPEGLRAVEACMSRARARVANPEKATP